MRKMTHNEIREMWYQYFTSHGHKKLESASLVPIDDDSLLWINAGVTPLKKYFDGREVPDCRRIVNIQKCIRTNDIENVGLTKRHQTFFEMMGNFSVGDYFKKDAIHFAFHLLTDDEWFQIPKDKIYVTYYPDDLEAKAVWIKEGLDESHLIPLAENFWEIGEGPCGPDSEIFYDRGEKYDPNNDALEKFKKDEDQERFVEIWNNVFSQFNAKEGVKREDYAELPSKNIDTGAGLERWCCIFQGVDSNFETDLFVPIIEHIEKLVKFSYSGQKEFKIIADHIRAITLALADGAFFDNNGRGYVLRRLLRRSVRFGRNLGLNEPFLYKLVSSVVEVMKEAYPYLVDRRADVEALVLEEEKLFLKTLEAGERRLKELVDESIDGTISGEDAFKYMNIQKELAKKNAKNKSSMASQKKVLLDFKEESQFVYGIYRLKTNVLAIFSKDSIVPKINHDCYIALKRTCCYAESGGQVSDTGMIIGKNFKARLLDCFKAPNGQHIHKVKLLDGVISYNDECEVILDRDRRKKIECNHSSVHMLQYALQNTVSTQIKQAGSYVDDNKLRFDFTYSGKMTDDKIIEVENFVNDMIAKNLIVSTEIMPIDKAKQLGAMALFNEKYGDVVRVVKIGKSIELCGGTHAANTKDIERFAIYSYESKGSNLFRIEAATGKRLEDILYDVVKPYKDEIIKLLLKAKEIVEEARNLGIKLDFDVDVEQNKPTSFKDIVFSRNELQYVQGEVRDLEKKFQDLREKHVLSNLDIYREHIKDYNGTLGLLMTVENKDTNLLKSVADAMIEEMGTGFVFFANIRDNGSINFISRSNCHVNSGLIVKDASVSSHGNGGGSPTFAQGGGKDKDILPKIYAHIEKVLKNEE